MVRLIQRLPCLTTQALEVGRTLLWGHRRRPPGLRRPPQPHQSAAAEAAAHQVASAEHLAAPVRSSPATPAVSQRGCSQPVTPVRTHCSRDCSRSAKGCRTRRTLRNRWAQLNRLRNSPQRQLRRHPPAQLAAHLGPVRLRLVPRRQRVVAVPWVAPQLQRLLLPRLRWALPRRRRQLHRWRSPDRARRWVPPDPASLRRAQTISKQPQRQRPSRSAPPAQSAMPRQQPRKPACCNVSRQATRMPTLRSPGAFPRHYMRRRPSRNQASNSCGRSGSRPKARFSPQTRTASASSPTE